VLEQEPDAESGGNELLYALAGGVGALATYGGARALWPRLTRSGSDADGPEPGPDRGSGERAPPAVEGSSVIESAVDENLDRAETAVADARRHYDHGETARALAACYRARTAATDAAAAAREYAPDRLAAIESQVEAVDDLVETIRSEWETR